MEFKLLVLILGLYPNPGPVFELKPGFRGLNTILGLKGIKEKLANNKLIPVIKDLTNFISVFEASGLGLPWKPGGRRHFGAGPGRRHFGAAADDAGGNLINEN